MRSSRSCSGSNSNVAETPRARRVLGHDDGLAPILRLEPERDTPRTEGGEVGQIGQVHGELVRCADDQRRMLHEEFGRIGPQGDGAPGRPCALRLGTAVGASTGPEYQEDHCGQDSRVE